jgi:hypothetical protein
VPKSPNRYKTTSKEVKTAYNPYVSGPIMRGITTANNNTPKYCRPFPIKTGPVRFASDLMLPWFLIMCDCNTPHNGTAFNNPYKLNISPGLMLAPVSGESEQRDGSNEGHL